MHKENVRRIGRSLFYFMHGRLFLHDMIVDFANAAREQGNDVTLQDWPDMNHDFQAFGDMIPESRDALAKLGDAVKRVTCAT